MQVKAADEPNAQVTALEDLLRRPGLDQGRRERIQRDLILARAGASGERKAAYQIELYFGRSKHWASIHDLRFEVDGFAAQIDHILINRMAEIWICESKHFSEGVVINESGEWQFSWQGELRGIPSPIEQGHRQAHLLGRVFDDGLVSLPRRYGVVPMRPRIRNLVLVSDNAWIDRPNTRLKWVDEVIHAEHLKTRLFDEFDRTPAIRGLTRLIGTSQLMAFAEAIAALHSPKPPNAAARFGLETHA